MAASSIFGSNLFFVNRLPPPPTSGVTDREYKLYRKTSCLEHGRSIHFSVSKNRDTLKLSMEEIHLLAKGNFKAVCGFLGSHNFVRINRGVLKDRRLFTKLLHT